MHANYWNTVYDIPLYLNICNQTYIKYWKHKVVMTRPHHASMKGHSVGKIVWLLACPLDLKYPKSNYCICIDRMQWVGAWVSERASVCVRVVIGLSAYGWICEWVSVRASSAWVSVYVLMKVNSYVGGCLSKYARETQVSGEYVPKQMNRRVVCEAQVHERCVQSRSPADNSLPLLSEIFQRGHLYCLVEDMHSCWGWLQTWLREDRVPADRV